MRSWGRGKGPAARLAAVAMLAVALAGCSTMDDMFGTPSPARDSTGAHPVVTGDNGTSDEKAQTAKSDQAPPAEDESGGFFDRMFGSMFGTPSPPRDSTGAHPMAESKTVPGEDKPYPNVGSVPSRPAVSPAEERQKMVQGLVADRADARYTDETLRREEPQPRQSEAQPAPAPRPQAQPAPQPQAQLPAPPAPPRAEAAPPAPAPAAPQTAALSDRVPATPPPPPELTTMAPIPNPPLAGEAPPRRALPGAGTAGPNFGAPPPDIDLSQDQVASLGPAGLDGVGSSFRVATVPFGAGSAKLDGGDERALRRVVALYKREGGQLRVVGHSSSFTRDMNAVRHQIVNFSLSLERAQAVARALERMGVPTASIEVAALSDSQPVCYESMPAGEAANRRAEIFLRR